MAIVYETDWLGSEPLFYNSKSNKASHNINDVIDFPNLEFDPEGLKNYLDFGYSVFEQTPIKHVQFLRHSSRLLQSDDGTLSVEYLDDTVIESLDARTTEEEVLYLLESSIQRWERSVQGDIVIPTSGGYDSRLLNYFIKDKSRIRSFTYGTATNQSVSDEVLHAKKLAKMLGTRWQQITLGEFNKYMDEWYTIFGASVHAHGMYQMEFYEKLLQFLEGGNPLLSGIIGDAWAGSVKIHEIVGPDDLLYIGYTHGMNADSRHCIFQAHNELKEKYFCANGSMLRHEKFRVVEAMRFKIILLSYLMRVPAYYGLRPWSPYLDRNIALAMLNLPAERRIGRKWQTDFFKTHKMYFEHSILFKDRHNTLNLQAMESHEFEPLNVGLLKEVLRPSYVEGINRIVLNSGKSLLSKRIRSYPASLFSFFPKLNSLPLRWNLHDYTLANQENRAYCEYLTIKPIENLIKQRNCAREPSRDPASFAKRPRTRSI